MHTGRWSHINTTHDLYELRKAGDREKTQKISVMRGWSCGFFCDIVYKTMFLQLCTFLTIDWPPITSCPSRWFLRALAGGRRVAAVHSTSLCCRWWLLCPGGEMLAGGTGSLRERISRSKKMYFSKNQIFVSYLLLQACLHWVWLCWKKVHSLAPQQIKEGWATAELTGTCAACVHLDHVLFAVNNMRTDSIVV